MEYHDFCAEDGKLKEILPCLNWISSKEAIEELQDLIEGIDEWDADQIGTRKFYLDCVAEITRRRRSTHE